MNKMVEGKYIHNGEEIDFNCNVSPSYANKVLFVNSVVNSIVTDNYNYIVKDLIFDYMLIKVFTDIDTSVIDKCEDSFDMLNMIEELVYDSNVVETIRDNIEFGVLEELAVAAEKGIEYMTGIHSNPASEALASLLEMLEEKLAFIDVDDTMGMAKKFMKIGSNFTPEKMLDAYSMTDIFKKQYEEIISDEEK